MRTRLLILMIVLLPALSGANHPLLRTAEKAYDEKKYRLAIESYEKLVNEGYTSYQLYYNLGNAYFRNNQIGKAIYNYELARKIEPDDEDVRINLAIAASRTIDKIDSKENFFISAVKSNVLSSLSTASWAWLSVFSIFTGCVLFFVYFSSTRLAVRRVAFIGGVAGIVFFVISYLLGYSATRAKYDNKFAIILSREAKIMNEPTSSATSKFGLHEGTKVQVVRSNGEWLLIKLDNGNEGWLKLSEVGVI